MDKIPETTPNLAAENAAKLLKLFPECAGERGEVDLEKLKQTLADHVIDGDVECYQFTWPGKRAAMAEANVPTTKTLAPCEAESVNFATTENLYIEGDNLEVLKILRSSYLGQVKMIYIDPPYNTGKDFVYHDRFSITQAEADERGGNVDDLGKRFTENSESNPRYHSDLC